MRTGPLYSIPIFFEEVRSLLQTANHQFYRSFFAIVIPIAIQNLINSLVGMADTVMLGFVSQTAMASCSLAGQVHFILNMIYGGLAAGITMLAAQYWGRQNFTAIQHILAIGVKLAAAVGVLFFVGTVFFPTLLMRIYTDDPAMIESGAVYLNTVGWSYLFMGLSHPYLSVMKSIERVKASTLINSSALLLNILLNAVFLFGWIPGIPPMGIRGVALATVLSRVIEFSLCLIDGARYKKLRLTPKLFLLHNPVLWRDFIRYSLPALGNEFVWGLAFSMYSVIMGRLGEDLVAANSIMSNMRNLASVLGFGVANGTAILLGKSIGIGDMDRAEKDARRLLWLTFASALLGSVVILAVHPILANTMSLTQQAKEYLQIMVWISAVYVLGPAMNTCWICGVFRAGGDSRFGFLCDLIDMWVVFVPLGFLAAFVFQLPPMWVYALLSLDEFAKMPVVYHRYRQKKWLRNITRDIT